MKEVFRSISPGFLSDIIRIFVQFYRRNLGKDPANKLDEFLEKFQTAFDPSLIFGKLCCKCFIMDMVAYMQGGMRAR